LTLIDPQALQRTFDALFDDGRGTMSEVVLAAILHLAKGAERAIAEQSKRIDALERTPFEYTGVHTAGKTYRRGQFATYAGGVWFAKCETSQRPANGSDWVLAVKSGVR